MENLAFERVLYVQVFKSRILNADTESTNHSWEHGGIGSMATQARAEYNMINHELPLCSILTLNGDLPLICAWILNGLCDISGRPDIQLHGICIELEPVCELWIV